METSVRLLLIPQARPEDLTDWRTEIRVGPVLYKHDADRLVEHRGGSAE